MLPFCRFSRFSHEPRNIATTNRVKDDGSGKPDRQLPISSANVITRSQNKHSAVTQGMKNITSGRILEVIAGDEKSDKDDCRVTSEFIYDKCDISGHIVKLTGYGEEDPRNAMDNQRGEIIASNDKEVSDDEEYTMDIILPKSRHRDGSIYRDMDRWWKSLFHIADRNETWLEAMALSNPPNCIIRNGSCVKHYPRRMLQILSLELDEFLVDGGLVELYGYIAVRDQLDSLLNYVVNVSRDDPIVVEQGSLINMTGPKRGIDMMDLSLLEYDMRIKTGGEEKNDLQLIDGASLIGSAGEWDQPLTMRIPGNYGAVYITLSRFNSAVEATVEVLISEVQCSFNLSLTCLTSQLSKEIRLFHGAIAGSRGLQRSVVAIPWNSSINLNFKVGALSSSSNQHYCSFMAKVHGHDTQEIKTLFALISVKVTWSMLPIALDCLY